MEGPANVVVRGWHLRRFPSIQFTRARKAEVYFVVAATDPLTFFFLGTAFAMIEGKPGYDRR